MATSGTINMHSIPRDESTINSCLQNFSSIFADQDEITGGVWSKKLHSLEENLTSMYGHKHCKLFNSATNAILTAIKYFLFEHKNIKTIICNEYTYPSVFSYLVSLKLKKTVNFEILIINEATELNWKSIENNHEGYLFILTNYLDQIASNLLLLESLKQKKITSPIIIDSALSLGVTYLKTKKLINESNELNASLIFSFSVGKLISAGEGGALLTNSLELAQYCYSQIYYGLEGIHQKDFSLKYLQGRYKVKVHEEMPNYKLGMSAWQAAIIMGMLPNLENYIRIREGNRDLYYEKLGITGVKDTTEMHRDVPINFKLQLSKKHSLLEINQIQARLFKNNIPSTLGFKKVYFQNLKLDGSLIPSNDFLSTPCNDSESYDFLLLPCHTELTQLDIELIVKHFSNSFL